MIRVAFLTRSLEVGGAEVQMTTLARKLPRSEFETSVMTFYAKGPLDEALRRDGVPWRSLDKRGRWDLLGFSARLARALRDYAPHIVHSYLGAPNLLAAAVKPVLPGSRLVWGVRESDMDFSHYDWTWRATFRLQRLLSFVPDLIIANSQSGLDHCLAHGFRGQRATVVPNGIDVRRFQPEAADGADAAALRRQWLAGRKGPLIGVTARVDPMKDHGNFLHAIAKLAPADREIRFACIGDGPPDYLAEMQQLARSLGLAERLVWAGHQNDMPAALNALDLNLLPSAFGEGFPNAVGEAMACGVPCVVTEVGDAARVVGEAGAVVPRRDPGALAAAIGDWLDLSGAQRQALSGRARQRIVSEFSADAMVARTAELYRRLVGLGDDDSTEKAGTRREQA
ncbi:MAG: glycosyltransferase [Alphaproteobacteria bacterium]|nr:glycosyltransferase [Alphaproteobacteria bacterium]